MIYFVILVIKRILRQYHILAQVSYQITMIRVVVTRIIIMMMKGKKMHTITDVGASQKAGFILSSSLINNSFKLFNSHIKNLQLYSFFFVSKQTEAQ